MIKTSKRRFGIAMGVLALLTAIVPAAAGAEQTEARADERPAVQQGFVLRSDFSQLCLDIAGGNLGAGAALNIWNCHGANIQRWYLDGSQIRSDANSKCITVAGGQNQDGAAIYMWDCNNWPAQQWFWHGRQLRSHNAPSKCLSVSGENRWPGGTIQLWECGSHPNQGWGVA